MQTKHLTALAIAALLLGVSAPLWAHCQIPCGIYGDATRFELLEEHIKTVEKSMKEITELSSAAQPNYSQIVRWVGNKEAHAKELTEIVTFYFMAQRVKPADPKDHAAQSKYVHQVTLLHQMVVHAMKAKQTTDLAHCAKLRELLGQFKASYLGRAGSEAKHDDHGRHRH